MSTALSTELNQLRVDHIGSLVRPAMLKDVFATLRPRRSVARRINPSAGPGDPAGHREPEGSWPASRY